MTPRSGNSVDFGIVTMETAIQGALAAFGDLNDILGFELRKKKFHWDSHQQVPGVTARSVAVSGACQVHASPSPRRSEGDR